MPIVEIELSQAVWDALQKACEAPEHREPKPDPDKPRRVIVDPKWDSPADLIEKQLEPILAQIAGPFMPIDPEINTLVAQQQAIAAQIAAKNRVVQGARKKSA